MKSEYQYCEQQKRHSQKLDVIKSISIGKRETLNKIPPLLQTDGPLENTDKINIEIFVLEFLLGFVMSIV